MLKLQGRDIYLATLERQDCHTLWRDTEYDWAHPTEPPSIGHSEDGADAWFDDIQRLQGQRQIRLGIFAHDGAVIGDVALQDIDRTNRCCTVGMGIARIANRGRGYGQQALALILDYAYRFLGLERVSASTLAPNNAARRALEKAGFVLEGTERQAVYLDGRRVDRLQYGLLREEWAARTTQRREPTV